ncbi:hypothetical protein ABE073_00375 [Lederbergia citrisecunda]|uniref:hypothetical protein n=1 Tax=Lederbergia citrisecunda TaxID=2833583 RepID=UPI003D2BE24F
MKEIKNVIGSQKTVPAVEIGKTTVYVRSNIEPYTEVHSEDSVFVGWKYDEEQYEKTEFFAVFIQKLLTLEVENEELKKQVAILLNGKE